MGIEGLNPAAESPRAEMLVDPKAPGVFTRLQAPELEDEESALRRRTSIPPTFAFGADSERGETDSDVAERRWRSFDCSQSVEPARLALLTARIQQESEQVLRRKARLGRRREMLRGVGAMFSSSKREQVTLLQMQLVAEVARGKRSLVVLNDMKTLAMALPDEDTDGSHRRGSFAASIDGSTQTLLDGIEHSDRVLSEDCLHHVLQLQAQFLQRLVTMHAQKQFHVSKVHGLSPATAMQQFLTEFVRPDGARRVPLGLDEPTSALVRFEKLVNRHHLLRPELKKALDEVCLDTMKAFTRASSEPQSASVFDDRNPRDVMQSLVRELVDALAVEAQVAHAHRPILHSFVEQMVFSRLACACYRGTSTDLDELNAAWREQAAKARALRLDQVGLPVDAPVEGEEAQQQLFAGSIAAFNRIPHLVPSSVLAAFMQAVCALYREAKEALGLESSCISADVLLPLLVFVLSRCELPHLHSQVFLMEQYAIDESQDGSEAAYYLACLQAAMGYITGKAEDDETNQSSLE
ncbi:hypothetical protein BBJ28_00008342 [Nothophytophthora sp. Chile5]|nr:hypothetical protein BBJ28_00008342 [Nothophytophthora sp. Chile5]